MNNNDAPIGVFDSGIGGLTVAAAIRRHLPNEKILYIGDTARVPYGGKSREIIERYSIEIAQQLLDRGAKAIVIACNTASALAAPRLHELFPEVPVQGVVQPGARAAVAATRSRCIGVMGTQATVASGAYEKAIAAIAPDASVFSVACPLLVPLIEEGRFDDPVTDQIISCYLMPLLANNVDTLVLGCTHYPFIAPAIARFLGPDIALVDSAQNSALAVKDIFTKNDILASANATGSLDVTLTDTVEGFLRLAQTALALDIAVVKCGTSILGDFDDAVRYGG